jgi:hypothetical protein
VIEKKSERRNKDRGSRSEGVRRGEDKKDNVEEENSAQP